MGVQDKTPMNSRQILRLHNHDQCQLNILLIAHDHLSHRQRTYIMDSEVAEHLSYYLRVGSTLYTVC